MTHHDSSACVEDPELLDGGRFPDPRPDTAGNPPPATYFVATLDLRNGFDKPIKADDWLCTGFDRGVDGFRLEDLWKEVDGARPQSVPFAGGSITWTRQSTPGQFFDQLSDLGYYQATSEVVFTTSNSPPSR